ncbi:MAG: arylamine N-acetyltransferase [Anaerolineae bacterium]
MDVPLYLRRINYASTLDPTPTTLRALHLAHLRAVPFENLDIHLKRLITLDLAATFDKIVLRRRGGFCFELNGLFASLLTDLGFSVTYLSASDAYDNGQYGPEFDHLALSVRCANSESESWLADVGWGDTFCEPLRLEIRGEQAQGLRAYRVAQEGDYRILWQRDYDGQWKAQYRFTLQPRNLTDFRPMCHYHQTSPESLFTRNRICSLATVAGRITLDNWRLITTTAGERQEQLIEDEATYHRILEETFGVVL